MNCKVKGQQLLWFVEELPQIYNKNAFNVEICEDVEVEIFLFKENEKDEDLLYEVKNKHTSLARALYDLSLENQ